MVNAYDAGLKAGYRYDVPSTKSYAEIIKKINISTFIVVPIGTKVEAEHKYIDINGNIRDVQPRWIGKKVEDNNILFIYAKQTPIAGEEQHADEGARLLAFFAGKRPCPMLSRLSSFASKVTCPEFILTEVVLHIRQNVEDTRGKSVNIDIPQGTILSLGMPLSISEKGVMCSTTHYYSFKKKQRNTHVWSDQRPGPRMGNVYLPLNSVTLFTYETQGTNVMLRYASGHTELL